MRLRPPHRSCGIHFKDSCAALAAGRCGVDQQRQMSSELLKSRCPGVIAPSVHLALEGRFMQALRRDRFPVVPA